MKVQTISHRMLALGMTGALALMASAGLAAAQDEATPTKEMIVESMVAEGAVEEEATCLLDALGDDWRRLMGLEGTR
jgi:predicted outer membrane protein